MMMIMSQPVYSYEKKKKFATCCHIEPKCENHEKLIRKIRSAVYRDKIVQEIFSIFMSSPSNDYEEENKNI